MLLGSNTNEVHAQQFRRQFAEVLSHFDALVLSYEIGQRKPNAGFYAHCQELAQAAPHEIVFIDDLPANIAGARATAGTASCIVPVRGSWKSCKRWAL